MKAYLNLLHEIYVHGNIKGDRTGTGTKSLFAKQMRFDLSTGQFPLLTTKRVPFRIIAEELLWFLRGETNIKSLLDVNVHIWDEWADENGDLGPVYGSQWRSWPGDVYSVDVHTAGERRVDNTFEEIITPSLKQEPAIDQIANVVQRLKDKPDDRRLIVSAWNPAQIDKMKLPPCHCLFQFYTREIPHSDRVMLFHNSDSSTLPTRYLDCQLYQRSADMFLGVPFNIASYSLLTMMIAQQVGMLPGEFIWTGGDCHIYSNHIEQVELQLSRTPGPLPKVYLEKAPSIFDYTIAHFHLHNYEPQETIKAPVAV